jgi:hypothetical protein
MLSSNIIRALLLSFLPGSFAIPTPQAQTTGVNNSAEIDWLPVGESNGIPVYVNSAAIHSISIDPAKKAIRSFSRRAVEYDWCGDSSFLSHPGPYAYSSDCLAIANCMY